ncbi:MAG: S1/P1 Nuclease, partial [Alphaproteobacteria bacterium]
MKRLVVAVVALAAVAGSSAQVTAWGNTGHRMIGVAAGRALPD